METSQLSGVQIVVRSLDPKDFPDGDKDPKHQNPKYFPIEFQEGETAHCCMCGGPLTKEYVDAGQTAFSTSWATQQELEAKDEPHMCKACSWMITGPNRSRFFPMRTFCVYAGDGTHLLDAGDFYEFLKNEDEFQAPCVIAIRDDMDRTKKHVGWKMNRSITYSRKAVHVNLFYAQLANGCFDGTASFDTETFLPIVDRFVAILVDMRKDPRFSQFYPKLWGQYYVAMKRLDRACRQQGICTEEISFAIYLAANIAFPLQERIDSKQPKKKGEPSHA